MPSLWIHKPCRGRPGFRRAIRDVRELRLAGCHAAWHLGLVGVDSDAQSPLLELRPIARRFLPDALRRGRSSPAIAFVLLAGLAGLAAAIASIHSWALQITVAIGAAVLVGLVYLVVWYWFAVFGARWTLYSDRLVVSRPGAKRLQIPLGELAMIRLEAIGGFGIQDPIYVFLDAPGSVLLWTVAGRWDGQDLEQLWNQLGRRPTNALTTVVDYQTMPYDRRY